MAIGIQDQYFGTEIEMTGITRQRAAEVVAELFGTRAVCDGGYYGRQNKVFHRVVSAWY